MAELRIVKARSEADIETARTLLREYAQWLGVDLGFQDFESEVSRLPGKYAPPGGELLLAELDEMAAGCVALQAWSEKDHIAEMKRLFVRADARGHGMGKRLIGEIIQEARLLGYRSLRLDSMAERMPAAIRLYQRFGFHEIDAYRYNPQPDAAYLELAL